MSKLELFVSDLQHYFSGNKCKECNIIRKHTRNLNKLGDASFPINISNWHNLLNSKTFQDDVTIFDYINDGLNLEEHCNELRKTSLKWSLKIDRMSIISPNVHIFFERSCLVNVLQEVLDLSRKYGNVQCLNKCYRLKICFIEDVLKNDLTLLRLTILRNVGNNFFKKFTINEIDSVEIEKEVTLSKNGLSDKSVLCGPVLNEKGLKTSTTSDDLYK